MPRRKKKATWSISCGDRGINNVRTFEKVPGGPVYHEWYDRQADGSLRRKRAKSELLDRKEAMAEGRRISAQLALHPETQQPSAQPQAPLTIRRLLHEYTREVTPRKGSSKQGHDRRAERIFLAFFDAQQTARRSTRHPSTLDRVDWDRFIEWRRAGRIPGWDRPVRDRQIQYDLKHMIAVLSWAMGVKGPSGAPYLLQNPWGEEVRRSQRWEMPKERNPTRVAMTDEIRDLLIDHAPHWQFGLALVIQRHTRRRNNQIRQLLWSDVDIAGRKIRWRAEIDKAKRENWTPMPEAVHAALSEVPRGIGDAPVFPSFEDPAKPTPRNTFSIWLTRAKRRAGVAVRGLGYHSEKRAGVRDPKFRSLDPLVQEELAGTSWKTLRDVYDEVSAADLEEAQRKLDQRSTG